MKKLRNYGIFLLVSLLYIGSSFGTIGPCDPEELCYSYGSPHFYFKISGGYGYERFSLMILLFSIVIFFVIKMKNKSVDEAINTNLKLRKSYNYLIIFSFVSLLGLLGCLFRWNCPSGLCYDWVSVAHFVFWLIFLIFLLLFLIFLIVFLVKNTNKKLLLLYISLFVLNLLSFVFGFIYFK